MPTSHLPVSTPENLSQAYQAVRLARQALQRGDARQARSHAAQATRLAPELEDGWLLLAAVASPRASVAYLQKALEINPNSQRARMGMHWAVERTRSLDAQRPAVVAPPVIPPPQYPPLSRRRDRRTSPWAWVSLAIALLLLCMASGFMTYTWLPVARPALAQAEGYALALVSSPTPGATETSLPAQTEAPLAELPTSASAPTPMSPVTDTPVPSETPVPTETPLPTDTPTPLPTATETPLPTATFTTVPAQPAENPTAQPTRRNKGKKNPNPGGRPGAVDGSERWIDVDLSAQTVFAMEGDQIVNQFIVSTGRWPTVTVTGVYRVYVKYHAADMSGADYYLPDVPYVMYFFQGYGLHGTYWHNNFGQPMSHGCVNLRTPDAGWLFEWASVGTVVNVHE